MTSLKSIVLVLSTRTTKSKIVQLTKVIHWTSSIHQHQHQHHLYKFWVVTFIRENHILIKVLVDDSLMTKDRAIGQLLFSNISKDYMLFRVKGGIFWSIQSVFDWLTQGSASVNASHKIQTRETTLSKTSELEGTNSIWWRHILPWNIHYRNSRKLALTLEYLKWPKNIPSYQNLSWLKLICLKTMPRLTNGFPQNKRKYYH